MPASALQQQLVVAFSPDELRQLASLRLGVDAATIWPDNATAGEAAQELVSWARRRGRLRELADAAAQERPGNEVLQMVARLLPAVCRDGQESGRRENVGTRAPGDVERRSAVPDPGNEYGNGVREALGRYGAQIDALREDVGEVREAVAAVPTMRQEIADVRRNQRAQFWVQLGLWASTLAGTRSPGPVDISPRLPAQRTPAPGLLCVAPVGLTLRLPTRHGRERDAL